MKKVLTIASAVALTAAASVPFFAAQSASAAVSAHGVGLDMVVRKAGTNEYAKEITVKPGETVQFRATAQNETKFNQKIYMQIGMSAQQPSYLTYIAGSAMGQDSNNPSGVSIPNTVVTGSTTSFLGEYLPNGKVAVRVDAKVSADLCGTHTMGAVAYANIGNVNESARDQAIVKVVGGECKEDPVYPPTGMGVVLGAAAGAGALATAAGYMIVSRKK